ncbi:EamA family transporter [Micromonospora sp. WMMD1082]|uniref:EamA family transporter n=1 Tax=Micromonospora sp. WMMD1082 TaxID=3016104 RepID=UPI0024179B14|nr:EamA family transporter [Micromonospora sp. WMMD1082]MDG4797981.1 EamA family transporter [Micromonospora sp. WMMD1082]
MEDTRTWLAVTAVAPITWGATYFVTREYLPADTPLWGGALRALPAGLLLLLAARRLPSGSWWWRAAMLGVLNFGAFFTLVYLAAQLLPTSIASSVMALAPVTLAGFGWLLLRERMSAGTAVGSTVGIIGALLLLRAPDGEIRPVGVLASMTALLCSSLGAILTKRWGQGQPLLAVTAWQMVAGGILLTAGAGIVEGAPPALGTVEILAFAFVSVIATAVAFLCWFTGMRHLPAATIGVIGLLNPVTGVLLGTALGGETLTVVQVAGVLLVLGGLFLAQRRARTNGRSPQRPRAGRSGRGTRRPPTDEPSPSGVRMPPRVSYWGRPGWRREWGGGSAPAGRKP